MHGEYASILKKNRSQSKCKHVENKAAPAQVRLKTTTKLARKNIHLASLVKLRSSFQPPLCSAALFSNVFNRAPSAIFLIPT